MFSRRLPDDREPNAWARALAARRAAGVPLLDLTESNPTRVGLGGASEAELRALADPDGARYEPEPQGLVSARTAVAEYYRARGQDVAPDRIVLTASTSEAYAHLFRLLADPGDTVLVPAPSYPLFELLAALEAVRLESYRLAYDGRWHLDLGSLDEALRLAAAHEPGVVPATAAVRGPAAALGRAAERGPAAPASVRALIVVQPNHPTGSCLTADEIAAVETRCERSRIALISDEVFGDFAWPPATGPLPSLLGSRRVPTFVLGGLSKSCGMPQLKLGWIVVAGPPAERDRALEGLEWIADLFLSVSTPVQLALPRLLEARHGYQARVRERIGINRGALDDLARRCSDIDVLRGEGGWTALLRLPARQSSDDWSLALLDRGVVVHPGHFYDLEGEAYLVVSLLPEPGAVVSALERLEALLLQR